MMQSNETEIGRTKPTMAGFYAVVTTIRFDHGAQRIRVTLFREDARMRHLDLTTEVARDLAPILYNASQLGNER